MSNRPEAHLARSSSMRKVVEEDRMSLDYEQIEHAEVPPSACEASTVAAAPEARESIRNEAVPKGPRQLERSNRPTSRRQTQTPEPTKPRYGPSNPHLEKPTSSRPGIFGGIIQSITGYPQSTQFEESVGQREFTHAESIRDHAVTLEALLQENKQALEQYKARVQQMEVERAQIIEQYNELSANARKLEADLKQKSALLDSRTMELRTAESFLTKYDDIPGDEIVNLVSDLNQQVLGIAAKLDELVKFKAVDKAKAESMKKHRAELSPAIGSTLCRFLESVDNNEDPTIIQLAIQAVLLWQTRMFLRSWPLSSSRSFAKNLWGLYDTIHRHELQAVASRWRALSSKHLRENFQDDARAHAEHFDFSLALIAKILFIAGATQSDSELVELIRKKLGQDIERLWQSAAQLAKKVKESVLSTDYEVICVQPGSDFDSTVAQSQGSQGQKSKNTSGKVLCTTDLGLRRSTSAPKQGGSCEGYVEMVVTSKATVVFEHEITAMLGLH